MASYRMAILDDFGPTLYLASGGQWVFGQEVPQALVFNNPNLDEELPTGVIWEKVDGAS